MRKLTIPFTLLLAMALVLGTVGCGGNNGENDEEILRERVDEQIAAMNNLDFETIYNHRSPSYRSRVTWQELEAFIEIAYAEFMPVVESGQGELKYQNLDIRIEGEYAYMTGELALNGTVLLPYTDESPDIWQKIDGTWYDVEENPMFPGYDPSELPD